MSPSLIRFPVLAAVVLLLGPFICSAEQEAGATIPVGLFVPTQGPDAAQGMEAMRGAEIAVERANREGGIGGLPLRLVVASSDRRWETASGELVRLIYDEQAPAVIGGLEGRSAHLAAQVITRARGRTVFLTPWASELTLTQARIPWLFRLVADDARQATALAGEIFSNRGLHRVAMWVADDFSAEAAADAFLRATPGEDVIDFREEDSRSLPRLLGTLRSGEFEALVLFAPPGPAAELVLRLHPSTGNRILLFAPASLAVPEFLGRMGEGSEGIILVSPFRDPKSPLTVAFEKEFRKRYEAPPGPLAAYAHDALLVLVQALRKGGDDLASILAATTVQGVTGEVRFDHQRSREGIPRLARVRDGALVPVDSISPERR